MIPFSPPQPRRDWSAMVHAFFDETGTVGGREGVFILAGFVANVQRWNNFTSEWGYALMSIGAQSLHTTDFLTNNGEHWSADFDLEERMETLRGFAGIVRRNVAGAVGYGVDCSAFREVLKDSPKHMEADVFCMQQIFAALHDIMGAANVAHEPLECCFDQSEKYAPRMLSAWLTLRRKKRKIPRQLLSSISFADAHYVPALQAADMLSCGINRERNAAFELQWQPESPFRQMFEGPDDKRPAFEFHFWGADELRRRKDEILAAVSNNT